MMSGVLDFSKRVYALLPLEAALLFARDKNPRPKATSAFECLRHGLKLAWTSRNRHLLHYITMMVKSDLAIIARTCVLKSCSKLLR